MNLIFVAFAENLLGSRADFLLILLPLTAGNSEGTFLTVQRIELEIHRAGEGERHSEKENMEFVENVG